MSQAKLTIFMAADGEILTFLKYLGLWNTAWGGSDDGTCDASIKVTAPYTAVARVRYE